MKLQCRSQTGGKGSQIEISYNISPILYGVNWYRMKFFM